MPFLSYLTKPELTMGNLHPYLLPFIISNIAAIIIFDTALTRLLLVLLFGWTSWLYFTVAHQNPSDYLAFEDYWEWL